MTDTAFRNINLAAACFPWFWDEENSERREADRRNHKLTLVPVVTDVVA